MEELKELLPYLPLLIPLMIAQTGLMVAALIHIFKHDKYKIGNRLIWVLVSLGVSLVGPILYFIFGRSDEGNEEE